MGYKAVYPDEAIQSHLAFPARRRAQRPTDEYRVPSDEEWQEFLGHFERRKIATGICGRAFGTSCTHEHACIHCPMLWPGPPSPEVEASGGQWVNIDWLSLGCRNGTRSHQASRGDRTDAAYWSPAGKAQSSQAGQGRQPARPVLELVLAASD